MLKAILVGADLVNDGLLDYSMKELESLAEASNIEVVYSMTQAIHKISPRLYIGKGKVDEVKQFVDNLDADMVIFNDELSGSQVRNLEEIIDCRVLDRTLLILDIFASRAKTKEAMLQVEIAQLEYLRPRLSGIGASLNRQQGGIGSRGPGEKKLELDRRKILDEIHKLKIELKDVVKSRQIQRKNRNRSNMKKIAIVGYTNAGKSTLLNALVKSSTEESNKSVFVKDMLFATLETATRHIQLSTNREFIVTDTVGFVSNLPHKLIESFKSTLEEVTEADFLIHVVDGSNEYHSEQIDVTNKTLEEIGVHDVPTLYVYNKTDLIEGEIDTSYYPNVTISLLNPEAISQVLELVEREVFKDYVLTKLLIPFKEGELVSHLIEHAHVVHQEYTNEGTILSLELSEVQVKKYARYLT